MIREHEQTLNVWLASHLREYGLNTRQESTQPGNRRIDVEVRIGPLVIAVEAEHGQSRAKQAEAIRDADARLQRGLAQCAVAVCYPDNTTEESLPESKLLWTVRDPAAPAPADATWSAGDLDQFVSVIRLTPAQMGTQTWRPPRCPAVWTGLSRGSSSAKSGNWRERWTCRKSPRQPRATSLMRRPSGPCWSSSLRSCSMRSWTVSGSNCAPNTTTGLSRRNPFQDDWPPAMAQHCANAADPIGAIGDAWNLILALDYKPNF